MSGGWNERLGRWGGGGFVVLFVYSLGLGFTVGDEVSSGTFMALVMVPALIYIVGTYVFWTGAVAEAGASIGRAAEDDGAGERPTMAGLYRELAVERGALARLSGALDFTRRYLRAYMIFGLSFGVLTLGSGLGFMFGGPGPVFLALTVVLMLVLVASLGHLAYSWPRFWAHGASALEPLGLTIVSRPHLALVPATGGAQVVPDQADVVYGGVRHDRRVESSQTGEASVVCVESRSPDFSAVADLGRFVTNGLPGPVAAVLKAQPVGDCWDGVAVEGGDGQVRVARTSGAQAAGIGWLLDLRLAEQLAAAAESGQAAQTRAAQDGEAPHRDEPLPETRGRLAGMQSALDNAIPDWIGPFLRRAIVAAAIAVGAASCIGLVVMDEGDPVLLAWGALFLVVALYVLAPAQFRAAVARIVAAVRPGTSVAEIEGRLDFGMVTIGFAAAVGVVLVGQGVIEAVSGDFAWGAGALVLGGFIAVAAVGRILEQR